MHTLVKVQLVCDELELRNHAVFHRAAEFGGYDADIDIICISTKQTKTFSCSSLHANCYGWRFFIEGWERQFGRINP